MAGSREHGVDLLADHRRGLRAQHHGGAAADRGFQLIEAGFQLPAASVSRGGWPGVSRPGSRMSVTRVKVSEISLPSSLATEYSMTRTVMQGMSLPQAPARRIFRESSGSAIATATSRRQAPGAPGDRRRFSRATARAPQLREPRRAARGTGSSGRPAASPQARACPAAGGPAGAPGRQRKVAAPSTARVPHSPSPTTDLRHGPRPPSLPG